MLIRLLKRFFLSLASGIGWAIALGFAISLCAHIVAEITRPVINSHFEKYVKFDTNPNASRNQPVLVIPVKGMTGIGANGADVLSAHLQMVRKMHNKTPFKAIVLDIDSPGGSAVHTITVFHMLKELRKELMLPIYAYIDGLCASGGYYMACSADKIWATRASLIGSVGVVAQYPNYVGLMEKLGLKMYHLYQGHQKVAMSPYKPVDPQDLHESQERIAGLYEQFLDDVTQNRPIERTALKKYGARVYLAEKALERGYIDHMVTSTKEFVQALRATHGKTLSFWYFEDITQSAILARMMTFITTFLHSGDYFL